MNFLKFYKKDLQVIVISTAIGGLLQVLCRQYIKRHPELFQENEMTTKEIKADPIPNNKLWGGADKKNRFKKLREINLIKIQKAQIRIESIKVLAKQGLWGGLLAGASNIASQKIPANAISTYL